MAQHDRGAATGLNESGNSVTRRGIHTNFVDAGAAYAGAGAAKIAAAVAVRVIRAITAFTHSPRSNRARCRSLPVRYELQSRGGFANTTAGTGHQDVDLLETKPGRPEAGSNRRFHFSPRGVSQDKVERHEGVEERDLVVEANPGGLKVVAALVRDSEGVLLGVWCIGSIVRDGRFAWSTEVGSLPIACCLSDQFSHGFGLVPLGPA